MLLVGGVPAAVGPSLAVGVDHARAPKTASWITVRSLATNYQFGELPTRAHQKVLGRVRLDRVARVTSVVIHGKRRTGDLLLIEGAYQNLAGVPSYWTEGYAFTLGRDPARCTTVKCGITPTEGEWWHMTHDFGTPIVDYPAKRTVAPNQTVTFREAIPMPPRPRPGASTGSEIRTLHDVWLLPIYAAFNYYEQPFPPSQLVRLSDYLGQIAFPRA
jgi:hypothetical protein